MRSPDEESFAPGPLANLVQAVAGRLLEHPQGKASRLMQLWRRLVGVQMARHTEPVRLQNGILTIRVDSSAWLTELNFLAPTLLKAFQEQLPEGTLKEFRFKQESLKYVLPARRKPPPPPRKPALPEEEARVAALIAPLTDARLQEAVRAFLLADMVTKRCEREKREKG
ncbi:MAG: DUF721 domain-containing protein [Magnetococcus sp. YQC-9]